MRRSSRAARHTQPPPAPPRRQTALFTSSSVKFLRKTPYRERRKRPDPSAPGLAKFLNRAQPLPQRPRPAQPRGHPRPAGPAGWALWEHSLAMRGTPTHRAAVGDTHSPSGCGSTQSPRGCGGHAPCGVGTLGHRAGVGTLSHRAGVGSPTPRVGDTHRAGGGALTHRVGTLTERV